MKDAKIILADETVLDEHAKKWLAEKKKKMEEINDCRALEAAREAAAADQIARMQAEHATQMQVEMAA